MDWDHARIALAVARSGQFLAAAGALGLDHATVARRIRACEAALGTPLFLRHSTGVRLTEAGERFIEAAERVETEMLRVLAELREGGIEIAGTVRIGAPEGFGNWFLAPRLGAMMARHPRLSIQLAAVPRSFSLSKREVDLAITIDRPEDNRLIIRKLTDYRLSFYAARGYLDQFGAPESLDDLSRHMLVTYVQDLRYSDELSYFGEQFGERYRRFECASIIGQREAVRAGAGIGILHDFAARGDGALVPILPGQSFQRTYWLLAHAETRRLARIAAVHDFLVESVGAERALFL